MADHGTEVSSAPPSRLDGDLAAGTEPWFRWRRALAVAAALQLFVIPAAVICGHRATHEPPGPAPLVQSDLYSWDTIRSFLIPFEALALLVVLAVGRRHTRRPPFLAVALGWIVLPVLILVGSCGPYLADSCPTVAFTPDLARPLPPGTRVVSATEVGKSRYEVVLEHADGSPGATVASVHRSYEAAGWGNYDGTPIDASPRILRADLWTLRLDQMGEDRVRLWFVPPDQLGSCSS